MKRGIFCTASIVSAMLSLEAAQATLRAQLIADSVAEFSGTQGKDGWFNGFRNYTLSGETENYDPKLDFIPYVGGDGQGPWDGFNQQWTGTAWDLETAAAGPWTFQGPQSTHPNGANSVPNEEHWTIRRWAATELTAESPLQLVWSVRKQNTGGGNGVTGGIWINGKKTASASIAGNNGTGVTRTNYAIIKPADFIDLVLTPAGPDGGRGDASDGSITTLLVERAPDTDNDRLPDPWENLYSPGDLTKLSANADSDNDGLSDAAEMLLGTNPVKADSDDDGLADGVETNTRIFVNASNTGTDPLNPDTDNDRRKDGDEVKGPKATDPFLADTDGDTYLDGHEASTGHDPSDPNESPETTSIANSRADFSGNQGEKDWFFGYRNFTADGGGPDYDAKTAFIQFTTEQFTGTQWDLNTAAAAPWTELGRENTHPNGSNNNQVHWTVRRWVANQLTKTTPLALHWHLRKSNLNGGNGVTGALHINGKEVDKATIAFNNGTGVVRVYFANLAPGDTVDLVHRPTGTDGGNADGADGSANWLLVDPVLPALPIQPDGSLFIPVGAGDSDGDGIPDAWERLFFPNDLTQLSRTGDSDGDGLKDPEEFARDSNPTLKDTDADGLSDLVESGTGIFLSANDTGSSPKKIDTDSDGLSDSQEVNGTPPTDPNKADTDGDGFSDPAELADGTNPNDKADNALTFVIANSIAEFSGVQGTNGWFNGYRNFTLDGGAGNYDPKADFVLYEGGEGLGPWDGFFQHWTGSAWDLNTAAAGPWTAQGPQSTHPNGANSAPNEEHWTIRRWVADEITKVTPVAIIWQVRKENPAGDGVTGSLYLNGTLLDSITIAGNNSTNPVRRFYVNLKPKDIVDLALTPEGLNNRSDGSDGSITWFWVDTRLPANPRQPDGTPFLPEGRITIESATFDAAQKRITIAWPSTVDAKYTIEGSTDLKSWSVLRADIPSGGNRTTFSESVDAVGPLRFYRLRQ